MEVASLGSFTDSCDRKASAGRGRARPFDTPVNTVTVQKVTILLEQVEFYDKVVDILKPALLPRANRIGTGPAYPLMNLSDYGVLNGTQGDFA